MYIALDGNSNMESLIPLTDLARGKNKDKIDYLPRDICAVSDAHQNVMH